MSAQDTVMASQLVELALTDWSGATPNQDWIAALEAGKVLFFRSWRSRCSHRKSGC